MGEDSDTSTSSSSSSSGSSDPAQLSNDEVAQLREELSQLRARNLRVEREKAWETSWVRRLIIAAMTWLCAWLWLLALNVDFGLAIRQALVPAIAYVMSTLTLPVLRQWWMRTRT